LANWDLYETRIIIDGNTERDNQINTIKNSVLNNFANSPSYFLTLRNGIEQGFNIVEENEIIKNPNKKRVICKPVETIIVGDIIEFDNSNWICTENDTTSEIYDIGIISRCNNTLLFYPSQSNENPISNELIEIPCIVGNISIGTSETKHITTIDNEVPLTLPNTEITRQIKVNDIYKLGLNSYMISNVANDISVKGLLIYKMKYSEIEQVVPVHSYSISILNGLTASIMQNDTLQLNIEVMDNDIPFSTIPTIIYTSSDESICTVDSNGLITAINPSGICIVTATYNGVSDSITISISAIEIHNYTVDITSSGILKIGQTITAIAQFKDNGINVSDIASGWWVLADDDISNTNLVTLTYDENICTIKANATVGYVRLHVGGYNCQNSIRIKIAGLW